MSGSPLGPHAGSPRDLKARMDADRHGTPYLAYRDGGDTQQLVTLDAGDLTIGRAEDCEIALGWDPGVSRVHARLERIGSAWTVVDDGLSRNGTYVNAQRLHGRRRLLDGDVVRLGATSLAFRDPFPGTEATAPPDEEPREIRITPAQRRVLVELCRPFRDRAPYATAPTNQQIAAALHLSPDSVKTHMRVLFDRLGVEDLPHNRKRLRLIEIAFATGTVQRAELET
jgi:pSer/pThr/pTyr-binding forkhead associated (FHA) protein